MAAPNSLYDLYIGAKDSLQGFRCRSLVRDSAPLVAARFATGQPGQTDLDLLKSASVDNVSGGMFQRDWLDNERVARSIGIFNKYDNNLYPALPTPTGTGNTANVSSSYYPNATTSNNYYAFIAYGAFSAGTYYNLLYVMTYANSAPTSISLPAGLSTSAYGNIGSMAIHGDYLFVSTNSPLSGGANAFRYQISTGTWQNIGSTNVTKFVSIRNQLYAITWASKIYTVTNETAAGAATYTLVDTAGSSDPNNFPVCVTEFNGAMWLSKNGDGLWRFDGVKAVRVLTLEAPQLVPFNGALYFVAESWLYRFDGATVQRLQYFGNQEFIGGIAMASNADYLWISTVVLTSGYSQNDKIGASATGLRRVYTYDGAGFHLWTEAAVTLGYGYNVASLCIKGYFYHVFGTVDFTTWQSTWWKYSLANMFSSSAVTSTSLIEITTSEFDDGFPNIFKSLEEIQPLYTGLISGDSLVVSYQYYNGQTWSAWQTAGTITSSTTNSVEITDDTKKLFKKLKVNLTLTPASGSTAQLRGVALRYTLQPRMRWRWQTTLMAEGNGTISDKAGTAITTDANALTNIIVKASKQKTPIFMLSPDYGIVKTQINSSALSFVVKGQPPIYTDPYNEYPLVAVKNNSGTWEILRVSAVSYNSGTDESTITVLERGYLGITAAQINANAEFHLAYKVYITRVLRDAPVLDENTYNEQSSTGESQLQREWFLEITEV